MMPRNIERLRQQSRKAPSPVPNSDMAEGSGTDEAVEKVLMPSRAKAGASSESKVTLTMLNATVL